jgi:DNA-binding MarR family transcriptional regulator
MKELPSCEDCQLRAACSRQVIALREFARAECNGQVAARKVRVRCMGTRQHLILETIRQQPGITAHELCRMLGLDTRNTSKVLVRLKGYDLIESQELRRALYAYYPKEQPV